ncbi:MAG: DUF4199 domain-containing protein [Gemmatimonadales bacterium]
MRKIVLMFGFISGAIMSGMMLATLPFMDRIGFDKGLIIGYTSMLAAFLLVYFGTRSYRDNVAGGSVRFLKAFQVGLLITLISCFCYVATWEVVYFKIAPDFADKYSQHELAAAKAKGATDQEMLKKRQEMVQFKALYDNPLINIAYTFIEPFPLGLVISLVCAGVLSRGNRKRSEEILSSATPDPRFT